jgi:photosystem II stability/assembly factor-like uncharacterized protein
MPPTNTLAGCACGAPASHRANPLRAFARLVLSASALLAGFAATVSHAADLRSEYAWKPVKIGGGGWVTGLLVHPTAPDLVYCRTDVGGVYRWQPATSSWTQLITADRMPAALMNAASDFPGSKRSAAYEVESIAIAPSNPAVLLVASGKGGSGVLLKSTDGGQSFTLGNLTTWMAGNGDYRTGTERLAVHPTNPNLVFFGSRKEGLWRSNDGGTTWTRVPASVLPFGESIKVFNTDGTLKSETFVGVATVVFDPAVANRVYASVTLGGIYRSDDSGATWTPILGGGTSTDWAPKLRLSQGILYAAGANGFGLRRYDPASGWTTINPGRSDIQEVAVDPANSAHLYAVVGGFQQFFRSTDSGASWTNLATNTLGTTGRDKFQSPHTWKMTGTLRTWLSIGALVLDPHSPGRLWFTEGMGVWRSDDTTPANNAPAFADISEGIEEMVSNDVVAMPGGKLLTAAWDRLGFLHTNPDQSPAAQISLTDDFNSGWSLATTPANPDFAAMVVTSHLNFGRVYSGTTLNGGLDWTRFASVSATGANTPEDLRFGELVVSATNPSHLVWLSRSGTQKPRYSTDGGATWTDSSFTGDDNNAYFFGSRRRLAADGAIGGRFYLHQWSPGRVLASTDGGATFNQVGGTLPSWTYHSQLKGVPGQAGHLWLAQGRDFAARTDAFSRSIDGGATWQSITFFDQAWAFGYGKPAAPGGYPTLFVYGRAATGAAWGVWRSSDQGATWDRIAEYPLGLFDNVTVVTGDPEIYGRVYIGWSGNSFAYGQPKTVASTPPATPVPSPRAGVYGGPLPVNLASSPGAEIRYTLDGTNPATRGLLYSGPFVLDQSATVRAIARRTGFADSAEFSGFYRVIPPAISTAPGGVTLERLLKQAGPLASVPFTTATPDQSLAVTSLEAPRDTIYNQFGQRIRGYITPAASGLYTFWLASDDAGELRLSADANPANAVTIASAPFFTSYRQWTKFPQQKSAPVALAAGNRYYIEARAHDAGAGDHLSVAWRPDTATPTPADIIPGSVLSPWGAAAPDPSVFHFETGVAGDTQGWTSGNSYTTALATSGERAALGARSLRAQVAKTDTTLAGPDLRVSNPQDAAGRTAAFRVWVPDVPGSMTLTAYSQHGDTWAWTGNTVTPVRGAWNTITLNVPASPKLLTLGVWLKLASPYTGPIYLDAVTY